MAEQRRGTMANLITEGDQTRQRLLKQIEGVNGSRVVSYLANPNASPNFMDNNDPIFFNDLLECTRGCEVLDVIIDSPGGEANVAERLAIMCRECSPIVRAIVINSAKSAATMFALSTDEIMMGYLSEIGPIDPQIRLATPQGFNYIPAHSLIGAVGQVNGMLQGGVDQRIVLGMVQKIDPAFIDFAQRAILFSKNFAETQLSQHMLVGQPERAKEIAEALSNNDRWLSHGKRIGIKEAQELGLKIRSIDKNSELWKLLWEYYARAQIHMNNGGIVKLYETSSYSLSLNLSGQRTRQPQQTPREET